MSPLISTAQTPIQGTLASGVDDVANALMKSGLVAFALVDSENVLAASPALRAMLGETTPYHHLDGQSLLSIVVKADRPAVARFCSAALRGGGRAEHRCQLLRADETAMPALLSGTSVPVGGARQLLLVVTDLTPWVGEAAAGEGALQWAAFDPATGFPGRALLLDRMKIALAAARRYRRRAALLRIDLDRFKTLLQSLSPEAADEVQATVAETLRNCARDCDTIARLGIHEFVVLLPEIGQREDAGISAARLVDAIAKRFEHLEAQFRVTAAIGVAIYPTDGTNPERLLSSAEAAMSNAKATKGGGFALADATGAELTAIRPLEFLERYCVGLSEIDEQHRSLVTRMNALALDLKSGGNLERLEQDLRAMMELLRAHFAAESSLLGTSPYDGAADSKTRNLRFLDELHCILLHVNGQSVALAIRHLYDWLVPHMLHLEHKMAS